MGRWIKPNRHDAVGNGFFYLIEDSDKTDGDDEDE